MTYNNIEFDIDKGVAILRLNRPDALNSFTAEMHGEVRQVLTQAAQDKTVRSVLLTGNGRGFCAGQDLSDRTVAPGGEAPDLGASVRDKYNPLVRSIMELEKPVVCAVNGVAAGAGTNIALACDIVLAARSASFIQGFGKIGLVPDSGGTWTLPRLVGRARAMGMTMLNGRISAQQAEQWGLIWQMVEDEELMDKATALAAHLSTQPTLGLGLTKKAINASAVNDLRQQLDLESDFQRKAGLSGDYREGVAAFMEKRSPDFKGA